MEIRFNDEAYDLEIGGLRKLLHDAVDEAFNDIDEPTDEDFEDLEEVHSLISAQDLQGLIDGFFCDGELTFIESEENDLLVNALIEAGYQVEKSGASRSLYAINDNGEEVRISDHKRPAIVHNGAYIGDHDYTHQVIVDGNVVGLNVLKRFGFSKLTKAEYLLG